MASRSRATIAAAAPGTAFEVIPHTRPRLAIAKRLTESNRDIPHFHVRRTVRIDALLALREQLNAVSPQKISVNDLVIRAVACAYVQVPDTNVIWTDEIIRKFGTVDVAVAIAARRGLVAPVLRGVEKATPSTISRQVKQFCSRQAKAGCGNVISKAARSR